MNDTSDCPVRNDTQVAVGTNLCHAGNVTVINGDKTENAPFLGRISHSWGEAQASVYCREMHPPLVPSSIMFRFLYCYLSFLLRRWKFSDIKIAL